jgi:hypothetical protein
VNSASVAARRVEPTVDRKADVRFCHGYPRAIETRARYMQGLTRRSIRTDRMLRWRRGARCPLAWVLRPSESDNGHAHRKAIRQRT